MKVECWSDRNEKRPYEVARCSNKKFYFDCDACPHEFYCSLNKISSGNWCPYCSNKKRCMEENCYLCFNNSFSSYDGLTSLGKMKVDCWSNINEKRPRDIAISSGKKFYFDCDVCSHEFTTGLNTIIAGSWCSYFVK